MPPKMSSRKRVREPPMRYIDTPTKDLKQKRGEFTDVENAELFNALLKFGPLDIGKLANQIPTRNDYQVKQRISDLQKKAQLSLSTVRKEYKNGIVKLEPREKVPIDRWLDSLLLLHDKAQILHGVQEELQVRIIARSMSFIAKYEDHPKPEECGGVNVKAVYEFMENMMLGLPSKTLNNADARFLIGSLQRLSSSLDSAEVGKEKSFVMCGRPQWRSKGVRPRTYGIVNKENPADEDEVLTFLDSDKWNPFQVPKEWLKKTLPY